MQEQGKSHAKGRNGMVRYVEMKRIGVMKKNKEQGTNEDEVKDLVIEKNTDLLIKR